MDFAGTTVLVAGLAQSGLAAVELLVEQGAVVRAADQKPLEELPEAARLLERLGVPFFRQSPAAFARADWIVVSPGVPADLDLLQTARQRGARVIGEVELAGYYLQGNTIGITGTNGKTTTTALAGEILGRCGLAVQVGGNIGIAPASTVARRSRPGQWNVLELSSFQLELIERFRAHVAVALNVTPDHLDRHYTFERYADAKARLFDTQGGEDFAVLNADDATCAAYARRTRGTIFWLSLTSPVSPGAWLEGGRLMLEGRSLMRADEVPLRGRHNVENALAAAMAARLAGAEPEAIAAAIRSFPGVEHRLEFVRRVRGADYYNDSKATNVDSAIKAIESFDGPLWVILGGKDKASDFTPLAPLLAAKTRAVMLVGEAAPAIAAQLKGAVELVECGTLEEAVRTSHGQAAPGDTVLLAPACASFDQFVNFEHRGKVFKELVSRLEGTRPGQR